MLKETALLTRPPNADDSSDAADIPRDVDKNFMSQETPLLLLLLCKNILVYHILLLT